MGAVNYAAAALPVAEATAAAHHGTYKAFAQPGAWWSGADRLALVRETRAAPDCELCKAKAEALSPEAVQGEHTAYSAETPPVAVEAVHGIRNDSGRLGKRWFDNLMDMGLQAEAYVELAGVVASSVVVDTFAQGVGLELPELPPPASGEPTFEASEDVVDGGAWVPIAREGHANILRSLGLVPTASALFFGAFGTSYFMRPNARFAIGRRQVELVASKVSAVNECFY